MTQQKQGWDTRAWLVGILGGTVGGGVVAWANTSPSWKHISMVTHVPYAPDWIMGVTAFLTALVLPGIVSGVARRRTFLWGLLPLILFLTVIELVSRLVNGPTQTAKDYWSILLVIGGCLLVSSGPVSLFRYRRARARRRREAAVASLVAQRGAASVPQEGVWPPPPDYRN